MGIVAADINFARTVEARIRQMGKNAAKHGVEFMRAEADEIIRIAREYAPEDTGLLEKAIQRDPNEQRDENNRKTVGVWVNPEAPGSGGMRVGDYAYLMHEGLGPYGDGLYSPGPGTVAKGPKAGGKFFERAIKERLPKLTKKIKDLLRRQGLK